MILIGVTGWLLRVRLHGVFDQVISGNALHPARDIRLTGWPVKAKVGLVSPPGGVLVTFATDPEKNLVASHQRTHVLFASDLCVRQAWISSSRKPCRYSAFPFGSHGARVNSGSGDIAIVWQPWRRRFHESRLGTSISMDGWRVPRCLDCPRKVIRIILKKRLSGRYLGYELRSYRQLSDRWIGDLNPRTLRQLPERFLSRGGIGGALGGVRRFFVGAVHLYRIQGVNAKQENAAYFKPKLSLIPPILFWVASNSLLCYGWWRGRRATSAMDAWVAVPCVFVGFCLSVWAGLILTNRIGI